MYKSEQLKAGNNQRIAAAELRKQVKTGEITLARAIDICAVPMELSKLLCAAHRVGPDRAIRLAQKAGLRADPGLLVIGHHLQHHKGLRVVTRRERDAMMEVCEVAGL